MLSGPEALLTFMLDSSFSTPSTVMVRGYSLVNTDLNCLLRILTLSLLSECKVPSTFFIALGEYRFELFNKNINYVFTVSM